MNVLNNMHKKQRKINKTWPCKLNRVCLKELVIKKKNASLVINKIKLYQYCIKLYRDYIKLYQY